MNCPKCNSICMVLIPASNATLQGSEYYCKDCHKSYEMTQEQLDSHITIMKANEGRKRA